MRKVFLFMMVSLDGFFEGVAHDLSWHNIDKEFNTFAIEQLGEADSLLFGRKTYELMAGFWPTEQGIKDSPSVAGIMNKLPKTVVSRSLSSAAWTGTQIIKDLSDLRALKARPGKAIALLGSSNLSVSLIENNLLDEIRLMINPVIIGRGTRLFEGLTGPLKFTLAKSRVFNSGNVLLTYKPKP